MRVQEYIYVALAGFMLTLSFSLIGFGIGVIHLEFAIETATYLTLLVSSILAISLILTRKTSRRSLKVCYNIFLVKDFNVDETVKELVSLAKFLKSLSERAGAFVSYSSKPNEPAKLCITLSSQDQLRTVDVYIRNSFKQLVFEQRRITVAALYLGTHDSKFKNIYIVKLDKKILCTYVCNLVKDLKLIGFQDLAVLDWKGYLKDCNLRKYCQLQNNYNIIDMSFTVSIRKRILVLKNVIEKHVLPIIVVASEEIEFLRLNASQKLLAKYMPIIVLCITI